MPESSTQIHACRWPDLPEPYNLALRQAVQFILGYVPDIQGILVSGTILRGHPSPSSDLDIYVLRYKSERQRLQRWFNGVPAEIFINPVKQVRAYLIRERKSARPITAHMLHTGFTILAVDDCLDALQQQAALELAHPPDPSPQQLTMTRYLAATRYEDATDVAQSNPETALMILEQAVYTMLQYAFLQANRYIPRDKDLLEALEGLDADLAQSALSFYRGNTISDRFTMAHNIMEKTIKTPGFFAWDSNPEELAL
ncbi:MAG: hypothetical protein P1S60_08365 [Anaerolineae bacterium]|nr:hypothetical protein [Anaerolineae bacterium]